MGDLELPGLRKSGTVDTTTDAPGPEALAAARRRVLEFVLACAGETRVARLCQQVQREAPSFAIDHSDDGSWRRVFYRGIRERGGREEIERDGGWDRVEGAYIRWLVSLPFARLGWVDYDPARDAFEPLTTEDGDPIFEIVVQPNFEVLVLGDRLDAGTLWRLARFARPAMQGRVRRYMLEKKSFTDALGRGLSAGAILELLSSLSRRPLPQNVRFSLEEWSASSERMKIWPDALLVEAEGVDDLAALLPEAARRALGLARIGGGHMAAVAPDAALLRQHVPPRRAILDYSRRLPPAITPQGDLRLHAPAESLHLRARQTLELVARRQGADHWLLDPALTRAAATALGPDELRRRVEEALTRPLEQAHALALRAWSGEFAPAFAGSAEVFLCDSDEQAMLLEQVPEFAAWLDRKLGRGAYLLRHGGAAAVRKLLAGCGVTLRDHTRTDSQGRRP
ncbi:MAG: helicase-associated domain-containing protein [Planctomycetes bacterium]|nr:helicase-associated domain-containing protein [Planctomycetota bacterium]